MFNDMRASARHFIGPIIGVCSIVYFGFHAIHGERGLLTYIHLKQKILEIEPILEAARDKREKLENQVYLLRPDSLDPDMLEERARVMLNYGYADDLVILYPQDMGTALKSE